MPTLKFSCRSAVECCMHVTRVAVVTNTRVIMPACSVKLCRNRSDKHNKLQGITFHLIPRDPVKRDKWIKAIQRLREEEDWIPSKSNIICSKHFNSEDFYKTEKGLNLLKPEAVPVLKSNSQNEEQPMDITEDGTVSFTSESMCIATPQRPFIQDDEEIIAALETPRKSKLRRKLLHKTNLASRRLKELNRVKAKYNRLRKKYNLLDDLKKNRYINEEQRNSLAGNAIVTELLKAMNKKNIESIRPVIKYPKNLRKFALSLNFYSPAAYKYTRRVFSDCLPHPRTLGKWYQQTNGEPGFTAESFDVLRSKSNSSEHKLLCNLVLDEMSIRQQKLFDGKKYQGYVDMGLGIEGDCQELASAALFFILVCINGHWKIPIGYFLINGLKAEQKTNLIKIALEKSAIAGVDVISMTFDGCPTNLSVMRILGCEIDDMDKVNPVFKHPSTGKDVVVYLDACHMLKLIRNSFEAKKVIYDQDNKMVQWKYLVRLNDMQNSEGLNFANKVKSRHVFFRNQIMKVKLAAQLLSSSVANALYFCENDLKLPQFKNSSATSKFIQIFNDTFDILNTRSRLGQYRFKHALCEGNKDEIFKFIDEAKEYIRSLKIKTYQKTIIKRNIRLPIIRIKTKWIPLIQSKRKTGYIGLIVCLESLKRLYENLIKNEKLLKYIPTYKFSQDHLELIFGIIRSQGGHNNNPNAIQLKSTYKKLLNHLELRSGFSGNAIPLEEIKILNCSSVINHINITAPSYRHDDESEENEKLCDDELDVEPVVMSQLLSDGNKQIVGYIAGFAVRYLLKKIKCEQCIVSLIAFERLWFHKLIELKDKGGLCYPSEVVYQICLRCECIVQSLINQSEEHTLLPKYGVSYVCHKVLKSLMETNIPRSFASHSDGSLEENGHGLLLIRALVEKYTNIKLHHESKLYNLRNKKETTRQLYNKLTLFKGL